MSVTKDFASSNTSASAASNRLSRREFLTRTALAAAALGSGLTTFARSNEPIIDIHQHLGYSGRSDNALVAHQEAMGILKTILLPAGRPMKRPSTHNGVADGLQAKCLGNDDCWRFVQFHRGKFYFAANEVPDAPGAVQEIERYLNLGGVAIAEQKFGIDCDAPAMRTLYDLAADYEVPILMHWQHEMYNYGFDRFYKMLEAHPRTVFIGHAQTWWANIDAAHTDQKVLYPKGKVTPGGLTDKYLSDYPNMYGDLSAGSGLNALTRDEDFASAFLDRHQDKLLYGSDCSDRAGTDSAAVCTGAQAIAAIRRLTGKRGIRNKIFYENARRLFRV